MLGSPVASVRKERGGEEDTRAITSRWASLILWAKLCPVIPSNRSERAPCHVARERPQRARVSGPALPVVGEQYGLGYTVRPAQFFGKVGVGHGGSNRGWESLVQIVPSTGDGIVIMTNSSNGSAVIGSLLCSWRQWAANSNAVECPTIDIRAVLCGVYKAEGAKAAVARYKEVRHDAPEKYDFATWQLNSMGYDLLRKGDVAGATEIFASMWNMFPQDANAYDSLGEAYLKQGDKAHAIENYRKCLDLNPHNDNARDVLAKLGVGPQ